MDRRVAELVLRRCLGYQEGESVLVVTDTGFERVGGGFHRAVVASGIDAALVSMASRANAAEEPPAAVAEAMQCCDIAVVLASTALTQTRAYRETCERRRVRVATIPGVDPQRLEHLLLVDYDDLTARCNDLATFLEGPHRIRLTTAAGTALEFLVGNRPVVRDVGAMRHPGASGTLPCGEVSLAPLEGTAQGVVVVNGSVAGFGLCERPISIRFVDGRAVEVGHDGLNAFLCQHGELAFNLAKFAMGMNPHAEIVGAIVEDAKALGTASIALGGNANLGGVVTVEVQVGATLLDPRVEIDGKRLPENLFTPDRRHQAPPRTSTHALDLSRSETYRALFEHSNDAQYVLDLETQRFLEVNPSFEKLSGYTRDELLSGTVTAPQLVAQESQATFQQKRETRRLTPSERYDLRVQCKDGQKKPIELSVRRMVMEGHEVVIGSVRDLTAHKRLEQEMWEKIQELGFASNRILALTEKIRRVPEFTPKLLSITDEQELLERATEMLCAREGLGYAEVKFYLLKGDVLEMAYSNTGKAEKHREKLTSESRLVRILWGEEPPVLTDHEAILPLKGRDRSTGVLEVSFHPKEIEVLEGNERALKGYQDLLETVSSIIGLLVENLHLYETVRLQSIVDPLTGVYNRRFFDQRLADEIHRAARYGRALALLLIDVDHFKRINDMMSYKQGDFVLVETAKLFKSHTREVDFVCRIGGDEFAIIMPETTYEAALQKSEHLRREVSNQVYDNMVEPGVPVKVTLSIGVTAYSDDVRSMDDMLSTVDEAIHAAKRAGRDTVCGSLPRASKDSRMGRASL